MNDIVNVLNKQIANWMVLFVKLHHFHWYVKGPQFFTLHVKFEELYNEAALHIDELAERVLALQEHPVATMRESLETASVKEASGNESAEQMVKTLVNDYLTLISELKDGMAVAEQANDETTADILLAIHTQLEKHVWMLSAFSK